MKGIVFTEFIEMVESTFSEATADEILEASDLESGGAYTSLGTYDHTEMLQLVTHLSEQTNIPVPDLVRVFGQYLLTRFAEEYPSIFEGAGDTFSFLAQIDDHIHVEVQKLYPDAQLPSFEHERLHRDQMVLTYRSARPFANLADGLIDGAVKHFGEEIDVEMVDLSNGDGTSARFVLTKRVQKNE